MAGHWFQRSKAEQRRIIRAAQRNGRAIERRQRKAREARLAEEREREIERRAELDRRRRELEAAAACKTCGGSRRVWRRIGKLASGGTDAVEVPCPSCDVVSYQRRIIELEVELHGGVVVPKSELAVGDSGEKRKA